MNDIDKKREEISLGIHELVRLAILNRDLPSRPTREILDYLHSQGVAIKVGEPSLVDDRDYFAVEPLA